MAFNISIGFTNLKNSNASNENDKTYALFLGETVVVNENEAATIITASKKQMKNIGMFLKVGIIGFHILFPVTRFKLFFSFLIY